MQETLATCSCKILSNTGSFVEDTTRGQSSTRQSETWLGIPKKLEKDKLRDGERLKNGIVYAPC